MHRNTEKEVVMDWLADVLQRIPLNAILKERVALAEQKHKELEDEATQLRETIAALTAENVSLKQQNEVRTKAGQPKPRVKWGCYAFEGDANLYCPAC